VDRKNQILLTSWSLDETTSELLLMTGPIRPRKAENKKEKTLQLSLPQAVQQKGSAPFPTKPRIQSSNTRIGHQRNNSRTFTKHTELFVVVPGVFVFSVLLTSPSLFS
jgi:hypothetical protein